MIETSTLLVDQVLPNEPLRQWVISFPYQIRYLLACHPELISSTLGVIKRVIGTYLAKRVGLKNNEAQLAAIALIQRFGSALNCNTHYHLLVADGTFNITDPSQPKFKAIKSLKNEDIESIVKTIGLRVLKLLEKKGYITKEEESLNSNTMDSVDAFNLCQKAGIVYRIAFGPRKGKKFLLYRLSKRGRVAASKRRSHFATITRDFHSTPGLVLNKVIEKS